MWKQDKALTFVLTVRKITLKIQNLEQCLIMLCYESIKESDGINEVSDWLADGYWVE